MDHLYSVKMRAARGGPHEAGGKHISGAERIVPAEELAAVAGQLVLRAQGHERGNPDFINIKIEGLAADDIRELTSLPVYTIHTVDSGEGLILAGKLLELAGIEPEVAQRAMKHLLEGPAPDGGNMRGAVLVDVRTGCRLEPDQSRGVRVACMDYHPAAMGELEQKLTVHGLNNNHVREALCLATKVASVPPIVAELCWSDDPGYTAGYVASAGLGYLRLEHLKERGSERGGRVFFFDPRRGQLEVAVRVLEREPCLITRLGKINSKMSFNEFKNRLCVEGEPGS